MRVASGMQAVAKQMDGHSDVVVKNAAHSKGIVVAKVPNGDSLSILRDDGEYLFVRWHDVEGCNIKETINIKETMKIPNVHYHMWLPDYQPVDFR